MTTISVDTATTGTQATAASPPTQAKRNRTIKRSVTTAIRTIKPVKPGKSESAIRGTVTGPVAGVGAIVSQTNAKPKKLKVIRDSFTMPSADYDRIKILKKSCLALGIAVKKSELLRAGLQTLQRLSNEDLKRVIALVETIKTGRPTGTAKKQKGTPREKD